MDTAAVQAAVAAVSAQQSTGMSYRAMQGMQAEENTGFLGVITQLTDGEDKDSIPELSNDLLSILASMMQGNLQAPDADYAALLSTQTAQTDTLLNTVNTEAISGTVLLSMMQAQRSGDTDAAELIRTLMQNADPMLNNAITAQYLSTPETVVLPEQKLADTLAWVQEPATEQIAAATDGAQVQIPVASVETNAQNKDAADLFAQSFAEGQLARTVRASAEDMTNGSAAQQELAAVMQQTASVTEQTSSVQMTQQAVTEQETQSVYEQTLTALTEHTGTEGDHYRIRLMPEGLGDITVDLTRTTEGLLTVNLTATSSRTAQMLSEQAGALQTALGPNVRDLQITVEEPEAELFYQQFGQEQYQQSFRGGTHGGMHEQHRGSWHLVAEESHEASGSTPVNGMLNTYI